MRLQTESRRMSQVSNLTLDLSRAGPPGMNGPPSARRASFVPLTGNPAGHMGHRRISSLSDPGLMSAPNLGQNSQWPISPGAPDPVQSARTGPPPSGGHSRRFSGMFGYGASPLPELPSFDASELDTLRKELDVVKEQLEETKHELSEAHEAKEASEMCVRALRTFIAENSVGEQTTRSNVRAGTKPAPVSAPSPSTASRWGFKLWNSTETPTSATPSFTSPASAGAAPSPVTKKLGGLFSPRSSISSTSSPARPLPVSASREPTFNGSDTSSIADSSTEPISPVSSMPRASVLVQDAEAMSFETASLPESTKAVAIPA